MSTITSHLEALAEGVGHARTKTVGVCVCVAGWMGWRWPPGWIGCRAVCRLVFFAWHTTHATLSVTHKLAFTFFNNGWRVCVCGGFGVRTPTIAMESRLGMRATDIARNLRI